MTIGEHVGSVSRVPRRPANGATNHRMCALVFAITLHAIETDAQPAPQPDESTTLDDSPPWARGVSATEQAAAWQPYAAGNAEFAESRYTQARAKYKEALDHWDHPAIRYNIAICSIKLGMIVEARDDLVRSLSYGALPLGPDMYEAGRLTLKRLEAQLSHLVITAVERGTDVTLDGKWLLAEPGTLDQFVLPGKHQIVATRLTFPSLSSAIVLGPGTRTSYLVRPSVKLRGGKLEPALELDDVTATTVSGSGSITPEPARSRATTVDPPEDPPSSRSWSRLRSVPSYSLEAAVGPGLVWLRSGADGIDPTTGSLVMAPEGPGRSNSWSDGHTAFSAAAGLVHPITHHADIAGRLFIASFQATESIHYTSAYVGASLQYWWREHLWVGLGQGLVFTGANLTGDSSSMRNRFGVGLELVVGYTVDADVNVPVSFSLELFPSLFPFNSGAIDVAVAALVAISIP